MAEESEGKWGGGGGEPVGLMVCKYSRLLQR